jgi:polyvinyl alcohol dehydrogenase (cytochrome)
MPAGAVVRSVFVLCVLACAVATQAQDGRTLFEARCTTCHGTADARTPSVAALRDRPPQIIVDALSTGAMREQGSDLTVAERRAIAEYIAGRSLSGVPPPDPVTAACANPLGLDRSAGVGWGGWAPELTNTRLQATPGFTADQLPKLTLKWAFGFPESTNARSLPTVAFGRVFVGSQRGVVYALDRTTGCTIWTFQAAASVRSGIVIGSASAVAPVTAYFGDGRYRLRRECRNRCVAVVEERGRARERQHHRHAGAVPEPTLHTGGIR